jgi:AAHS family 4-hydroxybenzoate transporter-like MFS transporter
VAATRAPRTIDLAAMIDGRKLSGFNYLLIVLSWAITMFDGLDMMMVSFTGPYMRENLGLTVKEFGYVGSAGTLGMVLGGLTFTYIADRIGRRPTVIWSAIAFGILTMGTALATNLPQLLTMRFLDGIAIGGMLPIAWALNIEFVPKRVRATVITVIMMGFSLGSAASGPLTNWIAPDPVKGGLGYGWQGVYLFGGAGTLLVALALAIWLPESMRFLVTKGLKPDVVVRTVKRLDPSFDIQSGDKLILGDEGVHRANFRLGDLFIGRLALLTPLVWFGYGISATGIFFGSTWGPQVLEALEIPRQTAAIISSIGGLLGAFTGIAIMRLADRFGLVVVAIIPAIIAPVLLILGFKLASPDLFVPLVVLQAMGIGGVHSAVISQLALFYPSAIRASAGGWASAVGKIGGVIGPTIGGFVIASGIPIVQTYAVLAICPAILFFCILGIAAVMRKPIEPVPLKAQAIPAE